VRSKDVVRGQLPVGEARHLGDGAVVACDESFA